MELLCKKCGLIAPPKTILKSTQLTAWCAGCGGYIKNIPQYDTGVLKLWFGKYKDEFIHNIHDIDYLEWCIGSIDSLTPKYKKAIQDRIDELKYLAK